MGRDPLNKAGEGEVVDQEQNLHAQIQQAEQQQQQGNERGPGC
jgi:hypothetical protein